MSSDPSRFFFVAAAVVAGTGVALGTFGGHGLRDLVVSDMMALFETGVRYQMYHAGGLAATAWAIRTWGGHGQRLMVAAGWSFLGGTMLFSGSLYALSLSGLRGLGIITPFGGTAFLVGWVMLAWGVWKAR